MGALPIAVARDCGCTLAYLPGLAMRKAADLYPGKSRTDARDAFIIAETARAMPHTLRAAGRSNVLRWARNHSRKDPVNMIQAVFSALGEQTVTVIGTDAVELVIPRVAAQIKELKHQRAIVAEEVEKLLDDFPLSRVLMSIPGVRIKTAATILLTIGDAGSFTSAGHLASYPASKAYYQKKRSQGKKHNAAVICTRP